MDLLITVMDDDPRLAGSSLQLVKDLDLATRVIQVMIPGATVADATETTTAGDYHVTVPDGVVIPRQPNDYLDARVRLGEAIYRLTAELPERPE